MIGSNLLRYQTDQEFSAIDLETENVNLIASRPWQVGMVNFTQKEDLGELNKCIWWPDLKIGKKAAEITKFNYAEYKARAEDPKKVLEEVEDIIHSKSRKIVNQNFLGFDGMILNNWRRALGLTPRWDYLYEEFKVYDTLAISRATKKGIKPDTSSSNAFLAWQYRMLSIREKLKCSLGAVSKELGVVIEGDNFHDALYDVKIVRGIFRKQMWSMELV